MNEIVKYIATNWVGWLFAAILALLSFGYRQISSQLKEDHKKNASIHDGVQALLRDRIIQSYNHYQEKGYCPIYGKENIKRMYDAYHSLGGNDIATRLKDTLLSMPEEPVEGEHKNE